MKYQKGNRRENITSIDNVCKKNNETHFQTKRNKNRDMTTSSTAPMTGPTIMSISISFPGPGMGTFVPTLSGMGLGRSGSFPLGAARMSNEMKSEKGDEV